MRKGSLWLIKDREVSKKQKRAGIGAVSELPVYDRPRPFWINAALAFLGMAYSCVTAIPLNDVFRSLDL